MRDLRALRAETLRASPARGTRIVTNQPQNEYARVDTHGEVDPGTLRHPLPLSAVRQSDEEGWGLLAD